MEVKIRPRASRGAAVTGLALLLVVCLAESASEQRVNNRGSKSNLIERINGWRSQRGGSCLSYGHSCWGAHGKRSGKPPSTAPDWFLSKLLRRMANPELSHDREDGGRTDDINAIFQDPMENSRTNDKGSENEDLALEAAINRNPEAKPMLDNDLLAKIKFWQIMREAPEEK